MGVRRDGLVGLTRVRSASPQMEPIVILCTCYLLFGSNLADIYTSGDLETYRLVRWLDVICLVVFYVEFILLCGPCQCGASSACEHRAQEAASTREGSLSMCTDDAHIGCLLSLLPISHTHISVTHT